MAERFQVQDRGYIREGYFADLVLLDLSKPYVVTDSNLLYLCGWSRSTATASRAPSR